MSTIINGTSNAITFPDATVQNSAGLVAGGTLATATITSATLPTATVTTLNAPSGVLATQNGMNGIAKAWLYYNGNTQTINGSYNVSSVTRNGSGDYTLNFTTALASANYATVGNADSSATLNVVKVYQNASGTFVAPTTSAARVVTGNGSTNQDVTSLCIAVLAS